MSTTCKTVKNGRPGVPKARFFIRFSGTGKLEKRREKTHVEDSTRAAPEHLAKRTPREYDASQIINGGVTCYGSADAVPNAIAPHPGEGRAAGVLRRLS